MSNIYKAEQIRCSFGISVCHRCLIGKDKTEVKHTEANDRLIYQLNRANISRNPIQLEKRYETFAIVLRTIPAPAGLNKYISAEEGEQQLCCGKECRRLIPLGKGIMNLLQRR